MLCYDVMCCSIIMSILMHVYYYLVLFTRFSCTFNLANIFHKLLSHAILIISYCLDWNSLCHQIEILTFIIIIIIIIIWTKRRKKESQCKRNNMVLVWGMSNEQLQWTMGNGQCSCYVIDKVIPLIDWLSIIFGQ